MKKGTWIIFGVAVVLGLLYYFGRTDQVSVGVKQMILPTVAADKIERIDIGGKTPVALMKREDGWKVKLAGDSGREVAADESTVKTLLDAAVGIRASHYVTNQKEKYAELGLSDEEATTVKLGTKEDADAFVLVLGKNATGSGRYVRLPKDDDVFVARGSFWQLTRGGVNDFRNRAVWPVKEADIDNLLITYASGTELKVVKTETGDFKFDADQQGLPKDFRLNKSSLSSLVVAAASINAAGFVDENKSLSAPKLTVKVGTHALEVFDVGAGDNYLVRRVGDEQIYEVNKHSIDRLMVSIDSMRDLSVMNVDKTVITEMTLNYGKHHVVAKKDEKGWSIVEPKKLPEKFEFDPSSVDDIVNVVANLTAERLAGPKDTAVSADWQKKWIVELVSDKGDKVHLFASKTKANKDEAVVRGNIDDNIYLVKFMRLHEFETGIDAFKKEDFQLPAIDERTKGFDKLPVDVQRKLLNMPKDKKQ